MMETPPRPPRSTDRTRDRRSSLHFDRLTSRWHLRSPSPSHPPFSSPSTADGPPAADTGPSASSAVKPLNVRKKGRKASTSAGLPPRGKASRPSLSTDAGALDRTVALARVVKHLIVESGPFTEVEDGLRVKLYLKISVPAAMLSESSATCLPLFSDHSLRIVSSEVIPSDADGRLFASSPSNHQAAQLFGMSVSPAPRTEGPPGPRPEKGKGRAPSISSVIQSALDGSVSKGVQSPVASISVRNFTVCLVLDSLSPGSPAVKGQEANFVVVLDAVAAWATVGPDWPYSVCLPTPPCLRNSLRLHLPPSSEDGDATQPIFATRPRLRERPPEPATLYSPVLGDEETTLKVASKATFQPDSASTSSKGHAVTKPRRRSSRIPRSNVPTPTRPPGRSAASPRTTVSTDRDTKVNEEARPLSDESEPEDAIASALESGSEYSSEADERKDTLSDRETQTDAGDGRSEWSGMKDDDVERVLEGVFQSTEHLWVLFSPPSSALLPTDVLTASKADSTIETFVSHTPGPEEGKSGTVTLDVHLSVDLSGIKTSSIADRIGVKFRRTFGAGVEADILSERWEQATGRAVIDSLAPGKSLGDAHAAAKRPELPASQGSTQSLFDLTPGDMDLSPPASSSTPLLSSSLSESDLLSTTAPFTSASLPPLEGPDVTQDISFESPLVMPGPSPDGSPFPSLSGLGPPPRTLQDDGPLQTREGEFIVWLESTYLLDCAAASPGDVDVSFQVKGHIVISAPASIATIQLPAFEFTGFEGQQVDKQVFSLNVSGDVVGGIQVPEGHKSRRLDRGLGVVDAIRIRPPPSNSADAAHHGVGPFVVAVRNMSVEEPVEEAPPRVLPKSRPPLPQDLLEGTAPSAAEHVHPLEISGDSSRPQGTIASATIDLTLFQRKDIVTVHTSIRLEVPTDLARTGLTVGLPMDRGLAKHRLAIAFVGGRELDPLSLGEDDESWLFRPATVREPASLQCLRVPPVELAPASGLVSVVLSLQSTMPGSLASTCELPLPVFPTPTARLDVMVSASPEHLVRFDIVGVDRLSPSAFRAFAILPDQQLILSATRSKLQKTKGKWSGMVAVLVLAVVAIGLFYQAFDLGQRLRYLELEASMTSEYRSPLGLPSATDPLLFVATPLALTFASPPAWETTDAAADADPVVPVVEASAAPLQLRPPDDFLELLLSPLRTIVNECAGVLEQLRRLLGSLL